MPNLDYKKFTISRIDSFINQILLLKELDFPYEDSSEALDKILEHIKTQRDTLEKSVLEGEALQSRCARATSQLYIFHRFVGYIRKSADPNNSFEIYFSFRRLAEAILGNNVRLIISSEWESYSPVNFSIPSELSDFVFIGLPVSEAENSLIVPLSGHELGHTIWLIHNFEDKYRTILQKFAQESSSSQFDDSELSFVIDTSLIKCAEYFCDFIGMGLFGESYLYAFAYLIAPKISKKNVSSHPNAINRAEAMTQAAKAFGYQVPGNFRDLFKTQMDISRTNYELYLERSEQLSFSMVESVITDVKNLLLNKNVLYTRSANFNFITSQLLSGVPISSANTLADITNASWEVYFKEEKLGGLDLLEGQKVEFLNELTIKSFEILEIKQRLNNDT